MTNLGVNVCLICLAILEARGNQDILASMRCAGELRIWLRFERGSNLALP